LTGTSGTSTGKDAPPQISDQVTCQTPRSPAVGIPVPSFMTSCTAQYDCVAPFSGSVMCTGTSTCSVSAPDGVYCDGNLVQCTCSGLPSFCVQDAAYAFCICRARGGSVPYCTHQASC